MFAWGCNTSGQLGLGDYQNRRAPCVIDGLWAMPVAALAAGEAHSAALTANGFMFTWGANDRGQLGLPKKAEIAAQVRPVSALLAALASHIVPYTVTCCCCTICWWCLLSCIPSPRRPKSRMMRLAHASVGVHGSIRELCTGLCLP